MELLGNFSYIIHIIAGGLTLIAGPIAILCNRNPKLHRLAGKVFFYAMSIVVVSSVIGFVKHPEAEFYRFLLGLSVLVGYNILRGVQAIQFMKGAKPSSFDNGMVWLVGVTGAVMMFAAVWYLGQNVSIAISILFAVFGLFTMLDACEYRRYLDVPYQLDKRWWLRLHVLSMFAALIASTTAFTVNAAHYLPWYLQWFGPAILFQPFAIYFMKSRKLRKRDLGPMVQPGTASATA